MSLSRPWERKPSQPAPTAEDKRSTDDLKKEVEQVIDDAKDIVDGINRQIDPQKQRVKESVERARLGLGTAPALESAETRKQNDAEAERTSKRLAAESHSYDRQNGESAEDHQKRVELLKEREIRQGMKSGVELMQRDALMAKMAKDDLLRTTPYPVGQIVKIEDDRYVCQFQPHPNLPTKKMTGDCLVVRQVLRSYMEGNEPRMEHVKGEVGMSGILRSQSNGVDVSWLFVVDAA